MGCASSSPADKASSNETSGVQGSQQALGEAAKHGAADFNNTSMSSLGGEEAASHQPPFPQATSFKRAVHPTDENSPSGPSSPISPPPRINTEALTQLNEVSAMSPNYPSPVPPVIERVVEKPPPAPAPAPPLEDDPWAALQAQYNPNNKTKPMRKTGGMEEDEDEFEMLAPPLSDLNREIESVVMGIQPQKPTSKVATPSLPPHASKSAPASTSAAATFDQFNKPSAPRGGDWGNGNLASAGTFMMGGDDGEGIVAPAPPSKLNQSLRKPHGAAAASHPPPQTLMDASSVPQQANLDDLGVADFDQDELDALMDDIEAETNTLGDDLAAKLARFEALDD